MGMRDRLKKTFSKSRGSTTTTSSSTTTTNVSTSTSTSDPADRTSSLYYQPGEKIPYKYRRPVEPSHKAKLEGFSWKDAWRRRSIQSLYSPLGSRMPSRSNSTTQQFYGLRSSNEEREEPLETIQSVQTGSREGEGNSTTDGGNGRIGFTPQELEEALRKKTQPSLKVS